MNLLKIGDSIKFEDDELIFKIIAKDSKYLVCTNNDLGDRTDDTVYTIVDLKERIRGPHNILFNDYDFTNLEDMNELLRNIEDSSKPIEISHRNRVALKIESVYYEI